MRLAIAVVTFVFLVGFVAAAPIKDRPTPDGPRLVGQTLTIEIKLDGQLNLPGTPEPDLPSYLGTQLERIKKVAEKDKERFEPVLVVRVPADIQYREVVGIMSVAQRAGFETVRLDSARKR